MKVLIVVQRYGPAITGGSEAHARMIAQRLAEKHQVTVATTCAADYLTWENVLPPGTDRDGQIEVSRFPTRRPRNMDSFNLLSSSIFSESNPQESQQQDWLQEQGPDAPELLEFISAAHRQFDVGIFFTYLYQPTCSGILLFKGRKGLVPTAHDEPALKLPIYRETFEAADHFFFNTTTERRMLEGLFPRIRNKGSCIAGVGVDAVFPATQIQQRWRRRRPYYLAAGRIEAGKGFCELFDLHLGAARAITDLPPLRLMGQAMVKIPESRKIIFDGFLTVEEKAAAFANAEAILIPSRFESLSMVLLEAFWCRRPVVVNGRCQVLEDHCKVSNGGLYYRSADEYQGCLRYLLNHRQIAATLGRQGKQYQRKNYSWQRIMSQYNRFLEG